MATALDALIDAYRKGLSADRMRFRVDADSIQIEGVVLRQGDDIKKCLRLLNLRRNRAETLTKRIHLFFCALAAARTQPGDGWLPFSEIGKLEGWSGGSVAKLLINELEIGSGAQGIIEQHGRGADAALRLRMPARLVEIGELPPGVQALFMQGRRPTAPAPEDVLPRSPDLQRDFATQVAGALYAKDRTLLVRPIYQGGGREVGNRSLVFGGLEMRSLGATYGRPPASTVVVKLPVGLNTSRTLTIHQDTLDAEIELLTARAAWPGLPARVESTEVELRFRTSVLAEFLNKHRVQVPAPTVAMRALIFPLGYPRTVEAEPNLLRGMIDSMALSKRRLTRRDIHNVLIVAERLATLTRLLHRERRAHRHLVVDAIVLRYELGIVDDVLAADLAASIEVPDGSDELLFRDLVDLGRVLLHMLTGLGLSEVPQDFDLQAGETVARLQFAISRYLLEAAAEGAVATVGLLEQFLYEIQHLNMLHWSKARGVPERPVPSRATQGTSDKGWRRSAADPVATRLVTISHLVDVPTLRSWCARYIESYAWRQSMRRSGTTAAMLPSAERCIDILRQGFGRSAASEMWTYLWTAGPNELVKEWVRVLRAYVTQWLREQRLDVPHDLVEEAEGQREAGRHEAAEPQEAGQQERVSQHNKRQRKTRSTGLRDELAQLRKKLVEWNPLAPVQSALCDDSDELGSKIGAASNRQLLEGWIDELERRIDELERRIGYLGEAEPSVKAGDSGRPDPRSITDDRLRSWMQAGALMRLLRLNTPPSERDVHDVELSLRGRNAPETVFWNILLARAWVSAAAHGVEIGDDEPGWDKAMRALVVAAGVAASRELPFEMAGTLAASAYLTRLALVRPTRGLEQTGTELRTKILSHGADEDSVRVQAAECALLAADTYLWLDCQNRHCRSVLEAAQLLMDCAFPERLVQALQLLSLARNHRILEWRPPELPSEPGDPAKDRFERYTSDAVYPTLARIIRLEQTVFDKTHDAWMSTRGRAHISDDPGVVVAHGYFARYAPSIDDILEVSGPALEFDEADVIALVAKHYGDPSMQHILDLGCGHGERARRLARTGRYKVRAVDSPVWFVAVGPSDIGEAPRPEFIERDPIEYAEAAQPAELDVILLHGSLGRISQRSRLLSAAAKLLRPGGLVIGADWVQTRTTDRITWSRLLSTLRFVDLETECGYKRLCLEAGFEDIRSWSDAALESEIRGARSPSPAKEGVTHQQPMQEGSPLHRFLQRRFKDTTDKLVGSGPLRSSYERAFLLRYKRHLETLAAMTTGTGPLGWSYWAARRPDDAGDDATARETD